MIQERRWLAATFAAAGVLCASAQEPLRMTMEQLFATAEAHNASVQAAQTAVEEAALGVEAARAAWRPDVEATAAVSYMGNVKIWDRPLKNKFTAATPHLGNNFALMARQTVYSGGAITSGIRLAKLGREMAEAEAEENRQRVRFLLAGHYLQLHNLRNQQEVFDQNIALAQTLISQTRRRAEQGIALSNDITRHELQVEQLRLGRARVEDAQRIISHQLATALGVDSAVSILPQDDFTTALCPQDGEGTWQQMANAHHTGLLKAALGTRMAEQKVQLERSERLPKVALVAEDHFDGPVTFEIPTLDKNINYWYVGVGVSYNFGSLWKNNKRLRQARTALTRSRQEQRVAAEGVENAIQAAYTDYLTAFTELRTQEKSVELAAQNYRIIQNRYENGLALVTDMTDAANVKLNAELALVSARINVIYNYYQLKYLSNTL
ncbi:MAG: TolC family protein [Bacteroidaceae bacterium]|nr:TolC family protein [Bacteroidaceae bacterium]